MTLVVARRFQDGIRVVGDTRLVDPWREPRLSFESGALKVVIGARGLCIAYAGEHLIGREALWDLGDATARTPTLEDAIRHLAVASRHGVTFIVAALTPVSTLAYIDRGTVTSGDDQYHAGDPGGFEIYQRVYLRRDQPELSASGPGAMTTAMAAVVDADSVPTVGGLAIEARTEARGFRYTGGGVVQTGPVSVGPGASDTGGDAGWWDSAKAPTPISC